MWVALLLACASDVREYADARADAICAWHTRCDTLRAAGFADEAECSEALHDAAGKLDRGGELGCEGFDADAAASCLDAWATAACDAPVDLTACDAVCP